MWMLDREIKPPASVVAPTSSTSLTASQIGCPITRAEPCPVNRHANSILPYRLYCMHLATSIGVDNSAIARVVMMRHGEIFHVHVCMLATSSMNCSVRNRHTL